MRVKLLLCFCLMSIWTLAQRQADNLINGSCAQHIGGEGCEAPYANNVLRFNDDSLEAILEPLDLGLATRYSRAAYSDANGNLAFASNGWRLVDHQGNVLSEQLYFDWVPWPGDSPENTMVLNTLGPLFLNDPGNPDRAYLFYGQYMIGNFGPEILKADVVFTHAYLDVPNRALISQNNIVMNDTSASGDMQACRHANGRDWWLIKPGIYEDEYFIGLLSPTGMSAMQKITIPGIIHRGQFETYSYFSFDGLKFLHFTGKRYKYLHEYDFDRCTGTLSNPVVHDLTDTIPWGDSNACTISPDGSKFYIRRLNWNSLNLASGMFQYDLTDSAWTLLTSIIAASPQLAPNGKEILLTNIIFDGDTAYRTLSRIRQPNLPGLACDLILYTDTMQSTPTFISPSNFANFRLGPLDGSACDTLGINDEEELLAKDTLIKVYPNPSLSTFTVYTGTEYIEELKTLRVYNALGQMVLTNNGSGNQFELDFAALSLARGVYTLQVEIPGTGRNEYVKLVYAP